MESCPRGPVPAVAARIREDPGRRALQETDAQESGSFAPQRGATSRLPVGGSGHSAARRGDLVRQWLHQGGKLVDAIYTAKPAELEGLISELGPYRYWATVPCGRGQ